MRNLLRISLLALVLASACQPAKVPNSGPTGQAVPAAATAAPDSIQRVNDRFVASVLARIAGRENAPAESVFKNIQLPNLAGIPARQFVGIMNGGYARALGVTCAHCHVTSDFASDEKRPKRAAREMAIMHFAINQQYLRRMEHLATSQPEERFINCATCHRGMVNPRGPQP